MLRDTPGNIRRHYRSVAIDLLMDLAGLRLEVGLMPAPEPNHEGHKVRVAVSINPAWWSSLYAAHPRKLDREMFTRALERLAGTRVSCRRCAYDRLAYAFVEQTLTDVHFNEDVIHYIETGVPF